MRRFVLAFVVVFVVTAALNFLIHGVLLRPAYDQVPLLSREPADGQAHAKFLFAAFFFFALGFVWIYSQGVEVKAWAGQGIRYGIAVWLIASVSRYLIYYAIQPWPPRIVVLQIVYELVMFEILGLTVAALYRDTSMSRAVAAS